MKAGIEVTVKGPLFDGGATRAVRDFLDTATEAIADQGAQDLRSATSIFRNPTGFYRSHIGFQRAGSNFTVDDGGIIYGPWLEGVGSRNHTTRFKGYSIWRRTTQRLQAKAVGIAERLLPRFLGRMQ